MINILCGSEWSEHLNQTGLDDTLQYQARLDGMVEESQGARDVILQWKSISLRDDLEGLDSCQDRKAAGIGSTVELLYEQVPQGSLKSLRQDVEALVMERRALEAQLPWGSVELEPHDSKDGGHESCVQVIKDLLDESWCYAPTCEWEEYAMEEHKEDCESNGLVGGAVMNTLGPVVASMPRPPLEEVNATEQSLRLKVVSHQECPDGVMRVRHSRGFGCQSSIKQAPAKESVRAHVVGSTFETARGSNKHAPRLHWR